MTTPTRLEPWQELPLEPVPSSDSNDTLDTQELPQVVLRPEEVVEMIPVEELSHEAVVALLEEPAKVTGSWDSIEVPEEAKDESLLQQELSSEEWRAWEQDFLSSCEIPAIQEATEDRYALDHLLLSELTHLELIDSQEAFASKLEGLLNKRSFMEWSDCLLRPGTLVLLEGLQDRLVRWAVRYFVQQNYGMALKLFYLLRQSMPEDSKVLNNIQRLEELLHLS
ncbi:MAG: hypothetical protein EP343_16560 [Deltaproteobacteria bacterium]|nr:MAG: hypothetical protein EP343_16560 [Deltaproteobacteria bacterium]